jgi:hypothetical protein
MNIRQKGNKEVEAKGVTGNPDACMPSMAGDLVWPPLNKTSNSH